MSSYLILIAAILAFIALFLAVRRTRDARERDRRALRRAVSEDRTRWRRFEWPADGQ